MMSRRVVSQPLSQSSLSCFEKGKRENSGNEVAVFFVCLFAFVMGLCQALPTVLDTFSRLYRIKRVIRPQKHSYYPCAIFFLSL